MGYREQYDRVKRYYDRFAQIDKGRPHDLDSNYYVDDIYSFFQNCYHLKDWIKNDRSISRPPLGDRVEDYIKRTRSLSLCRDLCNSTKHLVRTNKSGEKPKLGQKKVDLRVGAGPTSIRLKYQVDAGRGEIDAFQLATDCVTEWEAFLKAEKLL